VGPAANAAYASYQQASGQVTKVQGEINNVNQKIQARDKTISDTSAAAQQDRYQEALSKRPLIQNEYNTAVQEQNQLQRGFYAQNQASHGILVRLEALSQLSDNNLTVAAARFLLFLLFLVIECLPVTVKLLQKPGHYEAALRRARAAESRDVDMYYSSYSGYQDGGAPMLATPAQPRPDAPQQAGHRGGGAPEAGQLEDVYQVWHQTKVMEQPVGNPADEAGTQVIEGRDRPEFPPAENDPRASWGWRQSAATAPGSAGRRAEEERERDRHAWDDGGRNPEAAPTRLDYGRPDGPTRVDAPREYAAPAAEPAYDYGTDRANHDALNQVEEDQPAPVRSDGTGAGIALNWDDE
jgi:hypothetical protein